MDATKTRLTEVGSAIQAALEERCAPEADIAVARAQLLEEITRGRSTAREVIGRGGVAKRWAASLAFAAVAAVSMVWALRTGEGTFYVGASEQPGRAGDLLEASRQEPLVVRFSDGSVVMLRAGSRARVLSFDDVQARVLLEAGEAELTAVGKRHALSVEAGAFRIAGRAARFRVAFKPVEQQLELSTHEGSVLVSGACIQPTRRIVAGQSVELRCEGRSVAAAPVEAVSTGEPEARTLENSGDTVTSLRAHSALNNKRPSVTRTEVDAWHGLLTTGAWADAVRAAEQQDFGSVCRNATAAQLLALADAARLSNRSERAVEALTVLRQRFRGTSAANTAAFTLGRIAFDQRSDYARAIQWFSIYLAESPSGPLMGDAMGRLMESRLQRGDRGGAQADATRYLQRFPRGPYAGTARAILGR